MVEQPTPGEMEVAEAGRGGFIAAIPPHLIEAEDKLPALVRDLNSATSSKLHRIYQVAEELSRVRAPFVACKRGCSACCHMNVSLTKAEAERLARASGRKAARVQSEPRHAPDAFAGKPCPFLDAKGACSVYADRPLSCRKHASFFETAAACAPSVMNAMKVPLVGFSGLDEALFAVSGVEGSLLVGIRDFFRGKR